MANVSENKEVLIDHITDVILMARSAKEQLNEGDRESAIESLKKAEVYLKNVLREMKSSAQK